MKKIFIKVLLLLFFSISHAYAQEVVIVTNASNPINELSKFEVIGIYMGRYRSSDKAISVTPLDNNELKEEFYAKLINKPLSSVNSYWARLKFTGRDYTRPIAYDSSDEVINKLLNTEFSISYLPKTMVTPELKVIYELD